MRDQLEVAELEPELDEPKERRDPLIPLPHWTDVIRVITAFAAAIVVAVTIIGNRIHAQGNDAVFSQSLVLRAMRFGGTYYQNGIHPKGPLEEVAHDIALRVGGYDGHWYIISIMIAISSALIAYAAARTAQFAGANSAVAFAVAAIVFIHFTLSDAPYAGLLYSRNILVTLFAAAWILILDERPFEFGTARTQWIVVIAIGVLLGLAVQTIVSSLVDVAAIGLAALVLLQRRIADKKLRNRYRTAMVASGAFGLASAPIWYVLRGSFGEFWASWFTYASYQNTGIGLSFGEQLGRGWDNAYAYYQQRPALFLMIVAFVAFTIINWPKLSWRLRVVHLALFGWLLGGWFELITGQRYSTHYFSVIAAPSAMIGAALAGNVWTSLSQSPRARTAAIALPLAAILGCFYLSKGTSHRLTDAAQLTSNFRGVAQDTASARANLSGTQRSVQAVLDLVSKERDPLLLFDDNQYLYPLYRRIPATRFQQRYFLIGSIYLGRTSPQYILKGTWKWFDHDMRQANPVAFFKTVDIDSQPFADYVTPRFKTVFKGTEGEVEFRNDVADSVLHGSATTQYSLPPQSSSTWKVSGNSAHYTGSIPAATTDRLLLSAGACSRIEGVLDASGNAIPSVVFHVTSRSDPTNEIQMALDAGAGETRAASGSVLETVQTTTTRHQTFTLVIGKRAAALIVGNHIVAAVAVPKDANITMEAATPNLSVSDLESGAAPAQACS